jgi:hypothetical protein
VSVDAAIALGGVGSLLAGLGVLVWLRRIQSRRGVSLMAAAAAPGRKPVGSPAVSATPGANPTAAGGGTP